MVICARYVDHYWIKMWDFREVCGRSGGIMVPGWPLVYMVSFFSTHNESRLNASLYTWGLWNTNEIFHFIQKSPHLEVLRNLWIILFLNHLDPQSPVRVFLHSDCQQIHIPAKPGQWSRSLNNRCPHTRRIFRIWFRKVAISFGNKAARQGAFTLAINLVPAACTLLTRGLCRITLWKAINSVKSSRVWSRFWTLKMVIRLTVWH